MKSYMSFFYPKKPYRLSNRRKKLLTKEFMIDFLNNMRTIFKFDDIEIGIWHFCGTSGFYTALEMTCKKHNVTKAIFDFMRRKPWYEADYFDEFILDMLVERGIVSKENYDRDICDMTDEEYIQDGWYKDYTTIQYKGYSTTSYEWDFKEDDK